MKRWLVTGGLGFIGSNFIRRVIVEREDVEIVNFDSMTYAGNPANCDDLKENPRYAFVKGDICDSAAVERAIGNGVDAIVNFAAETHVDRSIHSSAEFLRTDVLGTHVLLDAVRAHKVARFVQVSTDEVYGDVPTGASTEGDALRPRSPYSASKAGGDLQVLAYWATYETPVLITRGSNTYGPYQYPEKLIPLFITNLIDGQRVPLYGDGLQVRDWIHVDDHTNGILNVLERGEIGHVYNVGGGNLHPNRAIAQFLVEACGRDSSYVQPVADREGHDRRYALNCEKIRALGWKPRVDFLAGLNATVEWYKTNVSWWRPLKSGEFLRYYEKQYAHR